KLTDALTAWDPATGKLFRRFADPEPGVPKRELVRMVDAVAVSPDGRLLAAAEGAFSTDRSVWVYETVSGEVVTKLAGHVRPVTDLAFSPDGRRLVSVSQDQTGLVWDVTLPALSGRSAETRREVAWERLSEQDARAAYASMAALVADPAKAVPLLREKLRPAP